MSLGDFNDIGKNDYSLDDLHSDDEDNTEYFSDEPTSSSEVVYIPTDQVEHEEEPEETINRGLRYQEPMEEEENSKWDKFKQ
jgi:hypothetical protein